MAAIKSYTDLEQSKKLAEILPLESADMGYLWNGISFCEYPVSNQTIFKRIENIPCWSLAALLSVIPNYKLSSEHNYHTCAAETSFGKVAVVWFDNPIDVCYELILKLHELNLL